MAFSNPLYEDGMQNVSYEPDHGDVGMYADMAAPQNNAVYTDASNPQGAPVYSDMSRPSSEFTSGNANEHAHAPTEDSQGDYLQVDG